MLVLRFILWLWLLCAWTFGSAGAALAEDAEATAQSLATPAPGHHEAEPATSYPQRWIEPGVLAASLAIVPGLVVHGPGAFVIGDPRTAKKLALSGAAGLGTVLAAGTLIAVTGSSRRLIGVLAPLTLAGFGVFALGLLADVYAASTGGRPDHAPTFAARVDAEVGYLHVHDPQFAFRSFLTARSDLRHGAFRVSPEAQVAVDDDNQRFLLELAYRTLGRTPDSNGRSGQDGSYFELGTGLRYQRFGRERFGVITPEWHLRGRLDLARVGRSLAGAFVEGQLGAGLEFYDYRVARSRIADNAVGLLLGRFGFGMYFGRGGASSGEASVYYDHRHDDFAAGLGVRGIPAGILGHFGVRGHYFVTTRFGVSFVMEVGSALVTGLSLRYRKAPEKSRTAGGA